LFYTKQTLRYPLIGKVGHESAAAKYAATTAAPDFSIQSDKPYAEVFSFFDMATDEDRNADPMT
jgi:hypothetical protein